MDIFLKWREKRKREKNRIKRERDCIKRNNGFEGERYIEESSEN